MTLETVINQLENASISVGLINGKINAVNLNPESTLTDGEAWDLIDSEGLRYIAPEPEPVPEPKYIEWRKAEIALPEFRQVCNAISELDATIATSLLIAYGKVSDQESLSNAVAIWNLGIHLISVTPEQVAAIQEVCDRFNIPLTIASNGETSIP